MRKWFSVKSLSLDSFIFSFIASYLLVGLYMAPTPKLDDAIIISALAVLHIRTVMREEPYEY